MKNKRKQMLESMKGPGAGLILNILKKHVNDDIFLKTFIVRGALTNRCIQLVYDELGEIYGIEN